MSDSFLYGGLPASAESAAGVKGILLRTLEGTDPNARESWIRDKHMVVFQMRSDQHQQTNIDIFVTEPFDFDAEYERALVGNLVPDVPVRFVGLETLLQMKEASGRAKDQEDIRQLRLLLDKERQDDR